MAEKLEDLNLPISVISRLIKDALPDGTIVSKEARTAIARAASVFVLYLTSTSNNVALKSKQSRKTISGDDVFQAVIDTDFEMFEEPLKEAFEGRYLHFNLSLITGIDSLNKFGGRAKLVLC